MRKYLIYLVFCIFLIASASAQEGCGSEDDPDLYCTLIYGEGAYCDLDYDECIPPEGDLSGTPPVTPTLTIPTAAGDLQSQINALSVKINSLQSSDINLQLKIDQLQASLNSLSTKLEDVKKKDITTFSTGLASLQKDLENITSEVNQTQLVAQSASAKINFWNFLWIFLIVIAIFITVFYFLQRSGKIDLGNLKTFFRQKPAPSRHIHNFITQQIRVGKKFSQIREELLNASWSPEEIEWAYKETTRKNYQEFLRKKTPGFSSIISTEKKVSSRPSSQPSFTSDKNKVMIVSLITIVLIVAGVFFLAKASGKAIYFEQWIAGSKNATSGEITYSVKCTPPHILNPERDGCCLDTNNNALCDQIEKEQNLSSFEIVDEGKDCIDNRQCTPALCINNKCSYLSKLYKMKMNACSKICSFYSAEILTSDGETYTIKPQEGSYSGAGAINWKLLAGSNHCQEEPTILPIKITKNKPGETLSEEIVAISKSQSSKVITHPYAPKLAFSLTVKNIHELCAYDEAELNQLMIKQKQMQAPIKVLE